jgi:hypothetical protein
MVAPPTSSGGSFPRSMAINSPLGGSLAERNQKKIIFSPWPTVPAGAMPIARNCSGGSQCRIHRHQPGWYCHLARSWAASPWMPFREVSAGGNQPYPCRTRPPLSQASRSNSLPRLMLHRLYRVAAAPQPEQGRRHLNDLPGSGWVREHAARPLLPERREEGAGALFFRLPFFYQTWTVGSEPPEP